MSKKLEQKILQEKVNQIVLDEAKKIESYYAFDNQKLYTFSPWKRLRHCTAETQQIFSAETGEYLGTLLKSYRTLVAFYDAQQNAVYDFLRYAYGYTSTSGQHIAKFQHDFCDNGCIRYTYYQI